MIFGLDGRSDIQPSLQSSIFEISTEQLCLGFKRLNCEKSRRERFNGGS